MHFTAILVNNTAAGNNVDNKKKHYKHTDKNPTIRRHTKHHGYNVVHAIATASPTRDTESVTIITDTVNNMKWCLYISNEVTAGEAISIHFKGELFPGFITGESGAMGEN